MYTTLIEAGTLYQHLWDPDWIVIDCRFDLSQPGAGQEAYLAGHTGIIVAFDSIGCSIFILIRICLPRVTKRLTAGVIRCHHGKTPAAILPIAA